MTVGKGANCIGYASLSVTDSVAVSLDMAVPPLFTLSGAIREAVISVESATVRWCADGTSPASTVGHLANVNSDIEFTNRDYSSVIHKIKFITIAGTAQLRISYFD